MKIAQIFDQTTPLVSGYSMRSRYISDSLRQLGIDLKVFSSPIFSYKNGDENINDVEYIRSVMNGWNYIKKIPFLKEQLIINNLQKTISSNWDSEIKLIDAHSSVLNGIAASKLAKKYKVPFLYEIRALWEDAAVDQGKTKEGSLRYKFTRKLETSIIEKSDKVTVICEGLRKDIVERGFDPKKIEVIPNGVDTELFKPVEKDEEIIKKYELKDRKVFGFVGTFFLFEGLEYLIKAAKKICDDNDDVKFLLVGGGHEEEKLKVLVKELSLEDKVVFTGRVKHDDIKKYYSVIDVLVYPRISKRITELVTPLKPLEAMALEKIVLGSDVGGIKELVKDGYNGFLFKSDDVDDLVDKCKYVLNNIDNMSKMAKDAREFVINERNWLKICEKYLTIYKELGIS